VIIRSGIAISTRRPQFGRAAIRFSPPAETGMDRCKLKREEALGYDDVCG
jgi:hypothetical protein